MAERVGDIFPVTSLQLEFQGYRLHTVAGYSGVTAGHTLKLPCTYCIVCVSGAPVRVRSGHGPDLTWTRAPDTHTN
jgi:hypothetical protein